MPRVDVALSFKIKAASSISGSATFVSFVVVTIYLNDGCQESTKHAMLSEVSNDF